MKFDVLKDVIIDGVSYAAGTQVNINHDKTTRLEMLGYIQEAQIKTTRSVGLEGDEKPRKRRAKKAED